MYDAPPATEIEPSALKVTSPLGIMPASTMSLISDTGGLGGMVTPVGSARLEGVTKPAGGLKFGAKVPPETGVKLSGSLGSEPGVDWTGTSCKFPVPTYEPSGMALKSAIVALSVLAS